MTEILSDSTRQRVLQMAEECRECYQCASVRRPVRAGGISTGARDS